MPDAISKQTGIPVETFIRLAREFASNQPSLAIGYRDRPFHQMAISILNGLVGNIDASGGILVPNGSSSNPAILREGSHRSEGTTGRKNRWRERNPLSCSSNPTSLRKIWFRENRIARRYSFFITRTLSFQTPNPDLFSKALSGIPLIVSFSPYMDDTTSFADLVLPDHTPLERWQDDSVFLNKGFPVLGIRQPVIESLYQRKRPETSFSRSANLWVERSKRPSRGAISKKSCSTEFAVFLTPRGEIPLASSSSNLGPVFFKGEDSGLLPIKRLKSSGNSFRRREVGGILFMISENGIVFSGPLRRDSNSMPRHWSKLFRWLDQKG